MCLSNAMLLAPSSMFRIAQTTLQEIAVAIENPKSIAIAFLNFNMDAIDIIIRQLRHGYPNGV